MVLLQATGSSGVLISEVVIILLIVAVLYVMLKLSKLIFKLVFGLIANSVLGLLALYALNTFVGLGIPIMQLSVIAAVAVFGLPAVGTLVILKLAGVLA